MPRARPIPLLILLLAASFAWLYRGALFRGETFVERDLATFHRAAKSLVPRLVHECGGLPQWNPYYSSGQPFAANPQHALFHPATALFLILPFEWAFRLQVMLPPVVAAAGMFFLLRSFGRRRWGSAFGALAWGLGGYTLSVTNLLPTLLATSVLPAVLAFAHRIARGGGRRDAAGLAIALGLEGLAGEPATLLATPLLLLPALGEAVLRPRRRIPAVIPAVTGRLALGLVVGVCLAAAALLPASRLAVRTTRAAGLAPAMADIWSMPPVRLAELASPYVFGHVEKGAGGFWGLRFYPGQATPFIYSLYMGLLAATLASVVALGAIAAPRRRRSWPALPWIGLGLVGVALAAGRFLPVWPALRHLPLLSGVRYPERFVLLTLVPVVVLAAQGFDRLVAGNASTGRAARALLIIVGVVSVVAGVFCLAVRMPLRSAQDAVVAAFTALALLVVLNALARRWRGAPAVLLALAALDLVQAGTRLVPTRPAREMATPPPVIRQLLDSPGWGPVFHMAGWVAQRERDFSFVRPPMPAFWGIATAFEPDFDLTELRWSTAATGGFLAVLDAQPRAAFAAARRRGVAALIRLRSDIEVVGGSIVKARGADSAVELRFLDTPRPLAFMASRVELAPGVAGWRDAVVRLGPAAADTVLIDTSDAPRVPAQPSAGWAQVREDRHDRIVVDVDAQGPAPGLVAVNQTWDEPWRARVDGRDAAVLRADLSLMAVVVPPGRHRLELTYRDPWVWRGLAVSACALVVLAVLGRPGAAP